MQNVSYRRKGYLHLSTACSVDVQGVSLFVAPVKVCRVSIYTTSIVDVQGVQCTPSTVSSKTNTVCPFSMP